MRSPANKYRLVVALAGAAKTSEAQAHYLHLAQKYDRLIFPTLVSL